LKKQCPICNKMMEEETIKACEDAKDWVVKAIKRDHPEWVASDGSCPRCLSYYNNLGQKSR